MIFNTIRGFILKGAFRKNVLALLSGNILSQLIYLLFTPVLTRIYSPSDFGVYAIFITLLSIFSVIVTGQYELTILLPKKESNFRYVVYGSVGLAIVLSVFVTFILLLSAPLLERFDLIFGAGMIVTLGISILINAIYQIGMYISLRNKAFKTIAIINIVNVVFSLLFQFLFSKTEFKENGLVLGYMIGTLVAGILFLFQAKNVFLQSINQKEVIHRSWNILARYKNFPLLNLPATLVNLLANQAPQLLLNSFGVDIIGHFAMSQKVLGSPVTLLSSSVSYVFKEEASRDYRNTGNCRPIFIKTFKTLFLISIIPFVLLFFLSPKLIPIIFGQEWQVAGVFTQALVIMYFLKFTVSPLSFVIIIAEKQKLNLFLQILLLLLVVVAIGIGIYLQSPLISIALYSISYSIIYLLFLLISYKLTKK